MTLKDLSRELNMFLTKTPNYGNKELFTLISSNDDALLIDLGDKLVKIKGGELLNVKLFDEEGAGE